MSLANKVAIVTGSSSGIGAAIAVRLTAEGARVAITGRNEAKLKTVSDICVKHGAKPLTIVADVSKDDDVKKIITETLNAFGKLDILVNNAGIARMACVLDDNAMAVFDEVIRTNLRASVYATHLAAKHLCETKGNIVNISSIAGLMTSMRSAAYSTSKAGLDHFSRCVALELSAHGVRVNNVNPGPVKTDIIVNTGMPKQMEDLAWQGIENMTTLNRIGESEEIADLVAFLVSDKARSITGTSIVSDNGALLKRPM